MALNLSRAVGSKPNLDSVFPDYFALRESEDYLPELELLMQELQIAGKEPVYVDTVPQYPGEEVYVYGRDNYESTRILPRSGLVLDNKRWLTDFSAIWEGQMVQTPAAYSAELGDEWADIPSDVYIKFSDKSSSESAKARFSVQRGKPEGKSPFLKKCFREGLLIAQKQVEPFFENIDDEPQAVQLVVLAKGKFLTGYVQYSRSSYIINDNSIHGPLIFEDQKSEGNDYVDANI